MTDKEIIKALEYCKDCSANLNAEIIDLINRKQAEIKEYKRSVLYEFADRLQIRCIRQDGCLWSSDIGAELKEILEEE